LERAREHGAGRREEIVFLQHEVGGEIVGGPAFDQRGSRRSDFVEEETQLEALSGVEGNVPHGRRSLPVRRGASWGETPEDLTGALA